ncbi:hypothetical protein Drorol1_Dr00012222 [Drosera rotundifolia]
MGKVGEDTDIFKMVKMIVMRQYDPVILFSFSKRDCEFLAMQMARMDMNDENEKANVVDDRGFTIDCDVAEKVLKRCFKVPYRALRFFDWAKLRNEGCCSTAVYNTMLYIAGEAKEFVLVENLVKEMEEGKCEKDLRTWTILLMQYGKAKLIGKALLIFDEMRVAGCEPDGEACRVMVRLLSTAGKGDVALEFYNEMIKKGFGLELDIKSYRMLLNCLTGSGDQDGVYSVADGMIIVSNPRK